MKKSKIRQMFQNNSCFRLGEVLTVNSNGSYDVKLKGRGAVMKGISGGSLRLKVGDSVNISFTDGNTQNAKILSHAGYATDSDVTEVSL